MVPEYRTEFNCIFHILQSCNMGGWKQIKLRDEKQSPYLKCMMLWKTWLICPAGPTNFTEAEYATTMEQPVS